MIHGMLITDRAFVRVNGNIKQKERTETLSARESRKGKHHSAGEVMHSSRLSSSPRSAGEFVRSSPPQPQPKGVRARHHPSIQSDPQRYSFDE
jgi:hypothetical protein